MLLILCSVASQVFSQPQGNLGYLKIDYDSTGIEIQLNNKTLGLTPLPIIMLTPGTYKIFARHPKPYLWGTFDWQDSIKIVSDDTLIIQPQFVKILFIKTDPFDADVFLNNKLMGQSPLSISFYSVDSSQLLVKKNGYENYGIDLNQVTSDYLNIILTENQRKLGLKDFQLLSQKKSKHRYKKLAYSFWGLSILTGLSTVYLKDQADEKYQQYRVAGSLKDMNKYYQDAKRLDRYTYVSMGILQGCFILASYFLMKSYSEQP